jgi:hypothetical protein
MLQSFKQVYYEMVMPLGAELWYQRNALSGGKKSPEAIYTAELPSKEGDEVRKIMNDKEVSEIYSEGDVRLRNALVFALFDFLFYTFLARPWREPYTVLELELRRKYSIIIEPHTFGKPRLPMIIQIGPSFYVHHNGRCCVIAGENPRYVHNAIILWSYLIMTEFESTLSYGEDASKWFKMFV